MPEVNTSSVVSPLPSPRVEVPALTDSPEKEGSPHVLFKDNTNAENYDDESIAFSTALLPLQSPSIVASRRPSGMYLRIYVSLSIYIHVFMYMYICMFLFL